MCSELPSRLFAATLAASVMLLPVTAAGCASDTPGPDPSAASVAPPVVVAAAPQAGSERPRFFVQWKWDLPGLTRRPAIAPETKPPSYPATAMREGVSGVTTLETCVTTGGRLVDIKVARSSGSATLDNATVDWAKTAKYLPALINGEAIAVCGYSFDYQWRVNED